MPGVYWFVSSNGSVLYVGKAKNLKKRLSSYQRITPSQARTHKMLSLARTVRFETLESEVEALLIEAQLIRAYQPPYNILLKDDKTPLYIIITKDKFPRVKTVRKQQILTLYSKLPQTHIFGPFSSSNDAKSILKVARRIFKFCTAPTNQWGKPCFYTHINLCSGACAGLISLRDYRQQIKNLKLFLSGKRNSLIRLLQTQMKQLSANQQFEAAAQIRDQLTSLQTLYSQTHSHRFDPYLPVLEEDANQDTLIKLSSLLHQAGLVSAGYPIHRIEAYDISNTSGQLATSSMVVFENAQANPSAYRYFKIKYVSGPNDPAMIKETLARRLQHPEWDYPQLIVIDGGKGQLNAALSLNSGIPTISIAKNPDRLLIPSPQGIIFLPLETGHPITNLIQSLRDESHRFSRSLHFKLRSQAMLNSQTSV